MSTKEANSTNTGGSKKLQDLLKTYEKIKLLENAYQQEMNRLEIEWLNLCSLAKNQDPASSSPVKQPLFKEAADLNAIPIKLDMQESLLLSPKLEIFISEEEDDSYDDD